MSDRLPAVRAAAAIRALERAGFVISRTSGSHCRLVHSTAPARKVTIPLHGATDLKRGTLRSIISQAGLTVAEFIALL
jgi:predicted RNA binding protein YcfA (HicA-like mRNA interferase family)